MRAPYLLEEWKGTTLIAISTDQQMYATWPGRCGRAISRSVTFFVPIRIGETAWACAPVGWDALTANQLAARQYLTLE
jgi:hypothetical protein